MSKTALSIFDCTMGHAGGNAAAEIGKSAIMAIVRLPDAALRTLARWQKRAEDRARLNGLDGRLLQDMGITGQEADREVSKPFWRA